MWQCKPLGARFCEIDFGIVPAQKSSMEYYAVLPMMIEGHVMMD